jgi:hypothetical protein
MSQSYSPPIFDAHTRRPKPDKVYHYTNQSGLLGIIENQELWATIIHFLNDSSEFRIAFKMIEDRLIGPEIDSDTLMRIMADPTQLCSLSPRQRRAYIFWRGIGRISNVNICVACFLPMVIYSVNGEDIPEVTDTRLGLALQVCNLSVMKVVSF